MIGTRCAREGVNALDLEDALGELLRGEETGDRRADLLAAVEEAWRRRRVNTEAGAAVIAALVAGGLTYREIESLTGIPRTTAQRWATPPDRG